MARLIAAVLVLACNDDPEEQKASPGATSTTSAAAPAPTATSALSATATPMPTPTAALTPTPAPSAAAPLTPGPVPSAQAPRPLPTAAATAEPVSPPQVRYVSDWGGSGVSHRDDCREAARTERPGLTDRQRVSRIAEGIGRCDGWSLVLADGRASWVRTGYLNDTPPVPFPRGPLPRSAEPLAPAPQAPFAMESAPAPLPGPFTAVSAGGRGACGLTREGDVVCWGGPLSRHEVPPAATRRSAAPGCTPAQSRSRARWSAGGRTSGGRDCWSRRRAATST